jgi:hypothetical protein
MSKLHELFPTAESLLELTPDTLAPVLLRVVAAERQRGMFWPPIVTQITIGSGMTTEGQNAYPHHKQHQVDALVAETFELLRRMGMIHPAPDTNGQNGWMVLSRDGEEAIKGEDGFDRIRALRSFPKELLHPAIAKEGYAALQRGAAFKKANVTADQLRDLTDIALKIVNRLLLARGLRDHMFNYMPREEAEAILEALKCPR